MEYRKILNNNEEISLLGFGLMRLEDDDDMIDIESAIKQLEYAVDNGINYFDTAYAYGDGYGSSEKALGEMIEKLNCREKIYISTKMDREAIYSRDDMEEMFADELNNLRTDYIDFYYIHNVISYQNILDLKENGLFDFIEDKKQKGQIINMGFSFHGSYEDFKKVLDEYDWNMTILQYNYLDTDIQAGIKGIKLASERGMGVFIMEPLKGGLLADRMPIKAKKIIDDSGIQRNNVDLGLSWVLNTPEVTCVLSGMKELDMVKENITIANNYKNNPLTDKELKVIEEVKEVLSDLIKINCSSCDYCLPCPLKIEISEIFSLYNDKFLFPDDTCFDIHSSDMVYALDLISENHDGSLCVDCNLCEKKCPQQLEISKLLKKVDKEFMESLMDSFSPFIKKIISNKDMMDKLKD